MSKIEVLRVPDERIPSQVCKGDGKWRDVSEGDLMVVVGGNLTHGIPSEWKPALLAALLEDAGAVKVDVFDDGFMCVAENITVPAGSCWLLPI